MAKVTNGTKTATTTSVAKSDDLAALVRQNQAMEASERAKTVRQNSFITLIKANSGALDENNPNFIKGLKPLDYAITSRKMKLGKTLDATILGMFKVYAEVTPKERDSDMARTVSFWMPDDAIQYPTMPGNNFDRQLPNGNLLQPHHWMFVYLHDFPEIEDGLITFRSKGNSIYAKIEKMIGSQCSSCAELRVSISNQGIANDKQKKTDYYPAVEITGRNYTFNAEGKIVKPKGSDLDQDTLREIITRSNELYQAYTGMKMIGKKQALLQSPTKPALTAGYEEEEDEVVSF